MLGNVMGKHTQEYRPDYVIFDLETTGISPKKDRVIEISALKVRNSRVVEEYSKLVNPQMPIPRAASSVNGITDAMVKNADTFDVVLKEFLRFIGDDVLVGHNIRNFDMKFLYRDSREYYNCIPDNDYTDTLILSRKKLPDLEHHRLSDLCDKYSISTQGAHRALNDCYMNQKVYEHLSHSQPSEEVPRKECPRCGCILKKRNGRFGPFWGCAGFPNCRYTENITMDYN